MLLACDWLSVVSCSELSQASLQVSVLTPGFSCGLVVTVSSPTQFAVPKCEGDLGRWLLRREIGSGGDKFMYTIRGKRYL